MKKKYVRKHIREEFEIFWAALKDNGKSPGMTHRRDLHPEGRIVEKRGKRAGKTKSGLNDRGCPSTSVSLTSSAPHL